MKTSGGFTVLETLVTIIFLGVVGTAGYALFEAIQMTHRDLDRKVAINTIHYNLEEVAKTSLNGYPRTLKAANLAAMDKQLLVDSQGHTVNETGSSYSYRPTVCGGSQLCSGYTLRATLEREVDFTKSNLDY